MNNTEKPRLGRGLTTVLVAALVFRMGSILWGLPLSEHTTYYHPDEVKVFSSVVEFPNNYLVSSNFLYGTAIQYIIGLLLLPVKAGRTFFATEEQYVLFTILFCRACTVFMGTATVWLTYGFARKLLNNQRAGLIAAALLCVAPFHCLHSSYCTLDVGMSFLLMANLVQCFRAFERGSMRSFVWLGVLSGLLLGTKFVGGLFLVVPLGIALIQGYQTRGSLAIRAQYLLLYVVIAAVVFGVSTPHVVLAPREYVEFMIRQKADWYDRFDRSLFETVRLWASATSAAVGWPTAVLSLSGLWFLKTVRRDYLAGLATFLIMFYVFWHNYLPPRFVIFVSPLLCVSAAAAVSRLFESPIKLLRLAGIVVIGGAVTYVAVVCAIGIELRSYDTRTQASRFIAETIPAGTKIGIATDGAYHWTHHQWRYPQIDFVKYEDIDFLRYPEILIVPSQINEFEAALNSKKLLPHYQWDPKHNDDWYLRTPPTSHIFRFYDELLAGLTYEHVKTFKAWTTIEASNASPEIRIYRRQGKLPKRIHSIPIGPNKRRL